MFCNQIACELLRGYEAVWYDWRYGNIFPVA